MESSFITNPAPTIPINAIKIPIPAVTACFIVIGMAFTTASLILNKDNNINIIPSINTAVKAISQDIPIPITTEKAKNALSPIPDASAKGKFANTPINIHPIAAVKQVAVTKAPAGIPVADNILGFTAII